MMKRRSFLVGGSSLALSQLMFGCNRQQQESLNVQLLKGSIPAQMLNEFQKGLKLPAKLNFNPENQLNDLFERLQTWKNQAGKNEHSQWLPFPFIGNKTPKFANLVTLGDYWLEKAIQDELIQPLNLEDGKGWQQLPSRWKELVRRDDKGQLAKNGQVWGAPYRWGTTVIAYRQDKFKELGWTPKDWSDLWRPELRDRISLLDQPREVIGLTLKKLGLSYNHKNLSEVPNLQQELLKLHQQVKYYSSDNYLEALLLGDTWLALGWSTDILSVRSSYRQIDAVVPLSGTALWTDVWVQPTSVSSSSNLGRTSAPPQPPADVNPNVSLAKQWIDFCWQPQPAQEISVLSNAASPIFAEVEPTNLPKALQESHLRLPDSSIVRKSEFLEPLPQKVSKEYEKLWIQIRSVKRN